MTLNIGDRVPDCVFHQADGSTIGLSDFLDKPLALIFLRHLA